MAGKIPRMALAVAAVAMAGIIASGCSGTRGAAGEPAAKDPTVSARQEIPATTAAGAPELPAGKDTTVSRVMDGDTIEVAGGVRVRMIGIDAPEISGGACFGTEAAAEARRLLPVAQRVRLVYDVERLDRYGRTLAYVYSLPEGRFVNLGPGQRRVRRTGHLSAERGQRGGLRRRGRRCP